MYLSIDNRRALSRAILSNVNACLDVEKSCPHIVEFVGWAKRVREGRETENDLEALGLLFNLPYIQPAVEDGNTPEDDARAAAFFLAMARVNGGAYPRRAPMEAKIAMAGILQLLA